MYFLYSLTCLVILYAVFVILQDNNNKRTKEQFANDEINMCKYTLLNLNDLEVFKSLSCFV